MKSVVRSKIGKIHAVSRTKNLLRRVSAQRAAQRRPYGAIIENEKGRQGKQEGRQGKQENRQARVVYSNEHIARVVELLRFVLMPTDFPGAEAKQETYLELEESSSGGGNTWRLREVSADESPSNKTKKVE
jgi:hypothetical protein